MSRIKQVFFFASLLGVIIPIGGAFGESPLLQQGDLQYQGAFRVPQGTFGSSTLSYGGTAMAYNPARNSLYIVGHDWDQNVAEISIPQIVNSSSLNNLHTATVLQNFTDATEGKLGSINPGDPNAKKIGGLMVYGGQLYISGWSYYDGSGTQSTSHFVRPLDLSNRGQVRGPYKVGNQYPGFVSAYMMAIPQEWQAALGGPALTGGCCHSIISLQSLGPAASVFNPNDVGSKNPVPATPAVGYPIDHPTLGTWDGNGSPNPVYNMSTKVNGIAFPAGTRTVLFFGKTGLGAPCYGTGAECNDPADSSKGCHAYPYSAYAWAYDVNDLIAVKSGQKNQWDIEPYRTWTVSLPFGGTDISSAAYDPSAQRIYVAEYCSDGNCYPVVHMFSIHVAAPPLDSQPPTSPSNLRMR